MHCRDHSSQFLLDVEWETVVQRGQSSETDTGLKFNCKAAFILICFRLLGSFISVCLVYTVTWTSLDLDHFLLTEHE